MKLYFKKNLIVVAIGLIAGVYVGPNSNNIFAMMNDSKNYASIINNIEQCNDFEAANKSFLNSFAELVEENKKNHPNDIAAISKSFTEAYQQITGTKSDELLYSQGSNSGLDYDCTRLNAGKYDITKLHIRFNSNNISSNYKKIIFDSLRNIAIRDNIKKNNVSVSIPQKNPYFDVQIVAGDDNEAVFKYGGLVNIKFNVKKYNLEDFDVVVIGLTEHNKIKDGSKIKVRVKDKTTDEFIIVTECCF